PIQYRLFYRFRLVPDGDGTTTPGLPICTTLGYFRCHERIHQIMNEHVATAALDANWWRQAAVYQIYPRSFADATGDGLGDLPGVTSRMGYLAELGIDAIWLSPFYPSALADGGYDVDDYRNVDPRLGTLE